MKDYVWVIEQHYFYIDDHNNTWLPIEAFAEHSRREIREIKNKRYKNKTTRIRKYIREDFS